MHFASLGVSPGTFNISSFLVNWCYSGFSAVLDDKLCSKANGCEKVLSRSAVCVP